MNRVFQNRAFVGLVLDLHTVKVFWSPELALNSVTLRWKRNLKGTRARHAPKVMHLSQDKLSESGVRPWMDFIEELVLSCPVEQHMLEPPDLSPFTRLTRLSCWYIPGMQFPETLVGLDLKFEEGDDGPNLPEKIVFPSGLEKLELQVKLLDCLGHEGLPKLESLRVFVVNPFAITHVYRAKKRWPPSLKSLGWLSATDVAVLEIDCTRTWLEQLPNLVQLSDIHFRIEDELVLPEALQEYEFSEGKLPPSSFSGLPSLVSLFFKWDMDPDYCYLVLEQVQKTLKTLNVLSFALENLPVLPQLSLLDSIIEPDALPLLNQSIPGVQFLDLLLLIKEDLDLDCSLFPRTCKALILTFNSDGKPCNIRIHGPLPESLEFLSLHGIDMVLESPLPPSIQRLEIPKYLIDPELVPEWVNF